MALDTHLENVESLYIGYFGRAGEPDGVNYWVGELNSGTSTLADIAASFSVQPEAQAEYAFLANPNLATRASIEVFVGQVYQNLFHRDPDAQGLDYWADQLEARATDPAAIGQFILDVISGAYGPGGSAADQATLENKVEAASYFTTELAAAGIGGTHVDANGNVVLDANVFQPAHSAVNGVTDDPGTVTASEQATDSFVEQIALTQDFTPLTPETLNGTDGNDTFNGIVDRGFALDHSTYQTADSAQGGLGFDTLNLTVLNSNTTVLLNGGSIEQVSVTNYDDVTFNALNIDGVNTISLLNAGGNVTFDAVQSIVTDVNIINPSSSNDELSINIDSTVAAPDELALNVNVQGVDNWTLDYDHGSGGPGDDLITALNINAVGENDLHVDDTTKLETITVAGSGSLELDLSSEASLTSIDAEALEGDFEVDNTINLESDLTFIGAQGDNEASFETYDGTTAHNLDVTGQDGADYFDVYMGNQGGTVTIDAGDGGVADVNGAQVVHVHDAAGATVTITTGSGVDEVVVDDLNSGSTLNASLGAGDDTINVFGFLGNNTTVDGGDGNDTLWVNGFDVDVTGSSNIELANITNIENLVVDGNASDIELFNTAGFQNFTFTTDTNDDITIHNLLNNATVTFESDQDGGVTLGGNVGGTLDVNFDGSFSYTQNGDLVLNDFATLNFNYEGNVNLGIGGGIDNIIDAQTITFTRAEGATGGASLVFDWDGFGDSVVNVTTLDLSGAFNTTINGELDGDLNNSITIHLGDFNSGSSISLDGTGSNYTDTLVFNEVTSNTNIEIDNFDIGPAGGHDILDLSAFGLSGSADLTFSGNFGQTNISFETAGGQDVTIELAGVGYVPGITSALLIDNNIIV